MDGFGGLGSRSGSEVVAGLALSSLGQTAGEGRYDADGTTSSRTEIQKVRPREKYALRDTLSVLAANYSPKYVLELQCRQSK